jgi:DSBA-like thioredoxin domain-containing protein
MTHEVVVYYDYACGDSHRVKLMLDQLDLRPQWKTVSLKGMRQSEEEPSLFDADEIESLSVLGLVLAHATRAVDFGRFHDELFEAFHQPGHHLTREEILKIAAGAGLDVGEFQSNQRTWLKQLSAEHEEAVHSKKVFGTPTVSVDGGTPIYVELQSVPDTAEVAAATLENIAHFAQASNLRELKRVTS